MIARPSLALMFRQAWDYMEFRWDRYVMAYGSLDQFGLLVRARDFLRGLRLGLQPKSKPATESVADDAGRRRMELGDIALFRPMLVAAGVAVLAILGIWWLRRSRFTATSGYRELRSLLARRDSDIGDATAPLRVLARVVDLFPDAEQFASSLIRLYLRESYAGHGLAEQETKVARQALRDLRVALRR